MPAGASASTPNAASLHIYDQLFNVSNRTIIVTGALGFLGSALIKALVRLGAEVVALDLPNDAPLEFNDLANTANGLLHYIQCNVTDEVSVDKAFSTAEDIASTPIRGLVTCAGISGRHPAVSYPTEEFRKIMDINVTGSFLCARAAARIMHKQMLCGSIVLIASMSGTNVNKGVDTCAYNSSKAAVLQLARNLAAEWGNDGVHPPIRVNTLSPGYIETPMTGPTLEQLPELKTLWPEGNMLGRLSRAEEHRSSIVFLLSDGSSFVTGIDLRADGGHCSW